MFELLPPEKQVERKRAYRRRVLIIFLWGVFLVFIIGITMLAPSYILLDTKSKAANRRHQDLKESADVIQAEALSQSFDLAGEKIDILTKKRSDYSALDMVSRTANLVPGGVFVDDISYSLSSESGDGSFRIVVHGVASTRDLLRDYVNELEGEDGEFSVDLPVSSYAEREDIEFSLTISK